MPRIPDFPRIGKSGVGGKFSLHGAVLSKRRKPQAPNRQRAGSIYILFLGQADSGRIDSLGGAYSTSAKALAAEERIQFPHDYAVEQIPLDYDMFPTIGDATLSRVDDDDLDDDDEPGQLVTVREATAEDAAMMAAALRDGSAEYMRPSRNPFAWFGRRFGRPE